MFEYFTGLLPMTAIGLFILVLGYYLYDKFIKVKGLGYSIIYAEKVNDTIIEHSSKYYGRLAKNGKYIIIKGLRGVDGQVLRRPIPPLDVQIPTNGKNKNIYILKLAVGRYAYRIPSMQNEVYTYKRDDNGHVIKDNKKKILIRHKWALCDDVIEEDDKAWAELMQKEIIEKHRKKDKWNAMKPVITMGIIFVFAVIALKITSDNWKYMIDHTSKDQKAMENDVDRLLRGIESFTGTGTTEPANKELPPDGDDGG